MNEQPSTAIGVLDMFSTSRTGIDVFSDQVIHAIQNGEVNALKVRIWLKTMEEIIDRVKKETAEYQLREAEKYPEKSFEYAGAKIEKAELGTAYNYSVCSDPAFERLDVDFSKAKADLDERKKFLQALKQPLTVVDDATGEVTTIRPPLKTSTTGLKVSIK
jgi:hypothetical protein